jgi:ketosteroid isomerase-like protein
MISPAAPCAKRGALPLQWNTRMTKPRTVPIYTTPTDAAVAFYQAFEAKDIDAMMSTWAEDEEIICVHPGGTRMVGYDAVRAGWEQIFAGDARLTFRLEEVISIETVGLAMQSGVEQISLVKEGTPRGMAVATNVFMRTPSGWRMVMHHASAAPAASGTESKGPLH